MKEVIKLIVEFFSYMSSLILRYEVIKFIDRYLKKTIWYAARRKFASVGVNSFIEWPFLLNGPENISIGQNFSALSCFRIETFTSYENRTYNPKLIIGNNVSFNNDCHIGCINRIEIGNNVLGASRIYITDHYHGNITSDDLQYLPGKRPLSSKGPVIIEDNVWIGEGVAILPGVTIGVNSIIGANSVVNKDIPANCVAAGIPARVVKHLN